MASGAELALRITASDSANIVIRNLNLNLKEMPGHLNDTAGSAGKAGREMATMGEKAGGLGSKLGGVVDVVGKLGMGVFGVVQLGHAFAGLAGGLLGDAIEAEKIAKATDAVIASTKGVAGMSAAAVASLATELSKVAPFEDDAIQGAENMLLTFTNIGQNVFPRATETVLNMSQALGQDLKSSAIQLGKALQDPITGASALRRVGVALTDQQEDQIKAFIAVNDVAGAQKLILDELQTEFGGAARAAGETFAGKMTILKTQIGNVKEAIGGALLPILSKMVEKLTPLAIQLGEWLPGALDRLGQAAGAVLESLKPFVNLIQELASGEMNFSSIADFFEIAPDDAWYGVIEGIGKALDGLLETLRALVVSFRDLFQTGDIGVFADDIREAFGFDVMPFLDAMSAVASFIRENLVPILAILYLPITLLIGAVALLATAWTNNWGDIQGKTAAVWAFVQPILSSIFDKLGIFWTEISPKLKQVWDNIVAGTKLAFITIVPVINSAMAFISKLWSDNWVGISKVLSGVWQQIQGVVKIAWALVSGIIKIGLDLLTGDWEGAWKHLKEMLAGIWEGIQGVVRGALSILEGVFDLGKAGIEAAWNAIWTALSTALGNAIGTDENSGLRGMIGGFIGSIVNALTGAVTGIWNAASSLGGAIRDGLVGGISGAIGGIGSLYDDLLAAVKSLINSAIDAINWAIPDDIGMDIFGSWFGFDLPDNPLPRLARGTSYFGGGLAMVGERGPELVALPRGSRVYGADETRAFANTYNNAETVIIQDRAAAAMYLESRNDARLRRMQEAF